MHSVGICPLEADRSKVAVRGKCVLSVVKPLSMAAATVQDCCKASDSGLLVC